MWYPESNETGNRERLRQVPHVLTAVQIPASKFSKYVFMECVSPGIGHPSRKGILAEE